jgi:hypothetical protein
MGLCLHQDMEPSTLTQNGLLVGGLERRFSCPTAPSTAVAIHSSAPIILSVCFPPSCISSHCMKARNTIPPVSMTIAFSVHFAGSLWVYSSGDLDCATKPTLAQSDGISCEFLLCYLRRLCFLASPLSNWLGLDSCRPVGCRRQCLDLHWRLDHSSRNQLC